MKKIYAALLICVFLLSGCTKVNMQEIHGFFPENIDNVQVAYFHEGESTTWNLNEKETSDFIAWAKTLSFKHHVFEEGSSPNEMDGGAAYEFHINNGEIRFTYIIMGENAYIPYEDQWYQVVSPIAFPIVNQKEAIDASVPMVMVKGKLYYSTNQESTVTGRCGVMDGEIYSTVSALEIPTKDNQSNFGIGYGYQFWGGGTIEVYMNDKWIVFEDRVDTIYFGDRAINKADVSKDTWAWLTRYNNLSEEQRSSINGIPEELLDKSDINQVEDLPAQTTQVQSDTKNDYGL